MYVHVVLTEVLRFVNQVQLLVTTVVESTAYTALAYSYWASLHDTFHAKAMPINDTYYCTIAI